MLGVGRSMWMRTAPRAHMLGSRGRRVIATSDDGVETPAPTDNSSNFREMAEKMHPDVAVFVGQMWRQWKYAPKETMDYVDRMALVNLAVANRALEKEFQGAAPASDPPLDFIGTEIDVGGSEESEKLERDLDSSRSWFEEQLAVRPLRLTCGDKILSRRTRAGEGWSSKVDPEWLGALNEWKRMKSKDHVLVQSGEVDLTCAEYAMLISSRDALDLSKAAEFYSTLCEEIPATLLRAKMAPGSNSRDSAELWCLDTLGMDTEEMRFLWASWAAHTFNTKRTEGMSKAEQDHAEDLYSAWVTNKEMQMETNEKKRYFEIQDLLEIYDSNRDKGREMLENALAALSTVSADVRRNFELNMKVPGELLASEGTHRPAMNDDDDDEDELGVSNHSEHSNQPEFIDLRTQFEDDDNLYVELEKMVRERKEVPMLPIDSSTVGDDVTAILGAYTKLKHEQLTFAVQRKRLEDLRHPRFITGSSRTAALRKKYDLRDPQVFWEVVRDAFSKMGMENAFPFHEFNYDELPISAKKELFMITEELLTRDASEHPVSQIRRLTHTQDELIYRLPELDQKMKTNAFASQASEEDPLEDLMASKPAYRERVQQLQEIERKHSTDLSGMKSFKTAEEYLDASMALSVSDLTPRFEEGQRVLKENPELKNQSFPELLLKSESHGNETADELIDNAQEVLDAAFRDNTIEFPEDENMTGPGFAKWMEGKSEDDIKAMAPPEVWEALERTYSMFERTLDPESLRVTNKIVDKTTEIVDGYLTQKSEMNDTTVDLKTNFEDFENQNPPAQEILPDSAEPVYDPEYAGGRAKHSMLWNSQEYEGGPEDHTPPVFETSSNAYRPADHWRPEEHNLIRGHGDVEFNEMAPFFVEDQPEDRQVDDPWRTLKDNLTRSKGCPLCHNKSCEPIVPLDYTVRTIDAFAFTNIT